MAGVKVGRGGLFGKSSGFSELWPYPFPVIVGVGLRQESENPGVNSERYRLAIRLQSAFELRPSVVRQIHAWFDEQCRDLFSVRWISKVVTLGSNPNGVLGAWKGAKALRIGPASGAALNVAGGAVGATAILVTKMNKIHLLTAGHVVQDDQDRVTVGDKLFSPVESHSPSSWDGHAATVVGGTCFPPYVPGRSLAAPDGIDYAVTVVEPGHLPPRALMDRVGDNRIVMPPASVKGIEANGQRPRVMKGPARTDALLGTIESVEADIIVVNEITGVSHFGRRLIEVSLDEAGSIRRGDSGALLSVLSDFVYQPLGIVVAGALTARLRDANNSMTSALYAVPFSSIPDIDQMGPV